MIKFRSKNIYSKNIYLKLQRYNDKEIDLVLCYRNGGILPFGYIFTIKTDGKIHPRTDINPDAGICLDEKGRILLSIGA